MPNFLKCNIYSILFSTFMVLNYLLLNIYFTEMRSDFVWIIWLAVHVYFYTAIVRPAEQKLREKVYGGQTK